ncbi:MAG: FG-GAP repeat domain-containing protein [Planctomycetota bacterium]
MRYIVTGLMIGCCLTLVSKASAQPPWTSPNRYHLSLNVDPRGVVRSNSPASVDIDFVQALADLGGSGTFDEHTVEVVAYNASNEMVIFDTSRTGYEQYLLPRHIQKYYGINTVTLDFVMPNHTYTQYEVYFDTVESGYGQPQRYHGLVGNGDLFKEGYKRREINANHFDTFCDFDGDGDLDLFEGGVECWVYCYENIGGNRFVDRGRLSNAGSLFYLPGGEDRGGRSWVTLEFYDWDNDGDMDFFPSFQDGPYKYQVVYYENTTAPAGPLTFTDRGPIKTQSGNSLFQGGWFPAITFVPDWDGDADGQLDVLVGTNNRCYLHRNLRLSGNSLIVDNPVTIKANGTDIDLSNPRFDVADIDNDGDRDLFAGCQPGPIYYYRNIDTTIPRTNPTFAVGQVIAFEEAYYIADAHSAVKVADFTGDGLLDFVVGRYWERSLLAYPEAPREYGWLYENDGSNDPANFIQRDATNGSPYTERFQICDAGRQNCVRAADWNNDGATDLIAGDTDGFIWYFPNLTNQLSPVFGLGTKLRADGTPIALAASGGHARHDICDWNNDGRKDLIAADGGGWVTLYLNIGTDDDPLFGTGQRVYADGSPIDRGGRSSVLVCDWNLDDKKDLVFADQENPGFYWFQNIGSDSNPILDSPMPIYFGGQQVNYVRPNLGDYVDFDGDGKKDFIGCHFETNIRLYKNIGSGLPDTIPQFSNPDGIMIVQPWNQMMTSGADAVDFNNDGDLDILTGQGHGGGGLRFYDRNYIDDFLNNTYPIVTLITPIAPSPIINFIATPGYNKIDLSWTNPSSPQFVATMIRYKTDGYPDNPSDGILLIDKPNSPGSNDSYLHNVSQLTLTYYYSAFAHNGISNYSSAETVSAMPDIPGDIYGDRDVDQEDFGFFQECYAGDGKLVRPGCEKADLNQDGVVGQHDLNIFLDCMGGANNPPGC